MANPIPIPTTEIQLANPLQVKRNSFKAAQEPQNSMTTTEPTINKNVLLNTLENGTQVHLGSLKEI